MKLKKYIQSACPKCNSIWIKRSDSKSLRCKNCMHAELASYTRIPIDLLNKQFGKLYVLSKSFSRGKDLYWLCKCECNSIVSILGARLRHGKTKSCGCIVRSRNGQSTSRFFRTWKAMMQRCYDLKASHYKRYGALGITVCDSWHDFDNFTNDMKASYQDRLTLDRIDNTLGYFKDNCRWATPKQQGNNKKTNYKITAFGITKTLQEWADSVMISASTLRRRIVDLKWNSEKAITQGVRKHGK